MKSKIKKIQRIKKGIVLILMLAILLPSTLYAAENLTLQASSALEKLMYGEVGSQVKKIEEYFRSNTTLYLTNEIQLRAFAEYVNNGNSCYGKRIELLNNIKIDSSIDWTPIGNSHSEFSGTFDGNGYTITNLTYKSRESYEAEGGNYNIGLFGVVSENGYIENVKVNNSNIVIPEGVNINSVFNVGNVVGLSYGPIENCSANKMPLGKTLEDELLNAEGDKTNNYTGLLVGRTNAVISLPIEEQPDTTVKFSNNSTMSLNVYRKNGNNYTQITDFLKDNNFKIGETIRLEFIIDTYLYTGLEDGQEIRLSDELDKDGNIKKEVSKENYPLVQIGTIKMNPISAIQDEKEMEEGTKKPQTTLIYEYTVNAEEISKAYNSQIKMNFTKNINGKALHIYYSNSENFNTGNKITQPKSFSNMNIYLGSELPSLDIETYPVELSETGRYPDGKEIVIKVKTNDKIRPAVAPELNVSFSESGLGKYNYQENQEIGNAIHVDALLDGEGKTTWIYSYIIQPGDEGILNIEYLSGTLTDLVGNSVAIMGQANNVEEIYADTTAPRVQITEKDIANSITNKDTITYEFKWSEQIEDFTADDITVNNGTKGELVKIYNITSNNIVANGDINGDTNISDLDAVELEELIDENEEVDIKYDFNEDGIVNSEDVKDLIIYASNKIVEDKICKYTMDITTNVENGNVGDLQVIIEDNVCQDLVGHGNVRSESVIRVDKKAPVLSSLEAYVESEIKLNNQIDIVKEYYKAGEKIVVVATFDENVKAEKVPELILKFSESGNSVVPEGTIEGNKIVYTYIIADGDNGTVSVRAFNGTISDTVGNSTNVTRKTLDGNTIIVDTDKPKVQLNVITPEGTYGVGKEIIIEAQYDEEVYVLDNNEIRLINTLREVETENGKEIIHSDDAPTLMIKFGDGVEREANVSGYGTKEDGSVDRTKIIYKYTIIPEDNGELSIVSYTNRENLEICDIAGNVSNNVFELTENGVIADTIKPKVENITAIVTDPSVLNTGIYHKAGNEIKITVKFDEPVYNLAEKPVINIAFSETEGSELEYNRTAEYTSILTESTDKIEFIYTIQEGDNGYLWVEVPVDQFKDAAGNSNIDKATDISDIFADTTAPSLDIYDRVTAKQEGQKYIITAEFAENVYGLNGDTRCELTLENAPKMIYQFGTATGNLEASATAISGNVITYEVTKEGTTSGTFDFEFFKGDLYDRAGNAAKGKFQDLDSTAPILESVEITSNAGEYRTFCKEGTEIYVIATFNEAIETQDMKIKVKVGGKEETELSGEIIEENHRKIKFTYTVQPGDNGEFTITDVCSNTDEYGYVRDKHGNQKNIDSFTSEKVTVTGRAQADTKVPYVEKIEAKVDGEVIASYTKEEGKDAIIEVGKTNANKIEYVITVSEPILNFDKTKISIINGIINEQDIIIENSTTIRIKVNTTTEGVQSLIISNNAADDRAGNFNELERFNLVTTDFTKPTVRFISEYNGGVYVLPTNIGKLEIRPNVEINEDISSIEYKWDSAEYSVVKNYSTSSDISIPTKAFTEAETYVLSIKVVDLAGNVTETSKKYIVKNSDIDIKLSTDDYTNQDVTATVSFGEGLTDNRRVTFKAEGSNEVVELNALGVNTNGGVQYIIEKNGTIYAEATDKVGNKVFTECKLSNIDKEAPVVELKLNGANLVIGTEKEYATIKTDVNVLDNSTNVESKYAYLQENIDVDNITEEQKAKISINLDAEAKIENAVSTKDNTPYYLYIIAVDEAGNETIVKSNPFTVLDTNERKEMVPVQDTEEPEVGNTITPGEENVESTEPEMEEIIIDPEIEISKLINFVQEGKYISISYNNFDEGEEYLDIIKDKRITLTQEKDGHIDYENYSYVEVNGATTITVTGKDACGNEVIATYEVTKDSIEGPEFEIIGNPKEWTNQDVLLEVYCYEDLSSLKVNDTDILSRDENILSSITVRQNGEYKFVATDVYGNVSEKTITITKIDKQLPVISKVENKGKDITITATDEISGVKEYAITKTTELPVEWSKSNVIKTTEDGMFYVWVKDNAGNVTMAENAIVVDTTAPAITFNYTVSTITAGLPIEATILTNEEAIISYSWNNEEMVTSENYLTNVKVTKNSKEVGKYTLYVKVTDKAGNASAVQKLEFNVVHVEEIAKPEIVFEDIPTIQINGVKYVKVSKDMTTEVLTEKMNKEALCGKTPEYKELTEENKIRTGSEITLNGETKYIVVVNGDVNCDGKVDFLGDIILANNYRIGVISLNAIQKLAADINNSGSIEFISDIVLMNNYRLGIINSL